MRVSEIFYSLQGEGVLIGTPTLFIRLSGCNLDCSWCDTSYARFGGTEKAVVDLVSLAKAQAAPYVCITGGEPLIQEETYDLVDKLLREGFHTTLETNGSMPLDQLPSTESLLISMDIKCPSSGMSERMSFENIDLLSPTDQLKFVLADERDMLFAESILNSRLVNCPVVFSPVGGLALKPLAEFVLEKELNVRVLPQLHKLIWGEKKGV